jgi:hypothetical protein
VWRQVGLLAGLKAGGGPRPKRLLVVDYTHPDAVNKNGAFYARYGLDVVMVREGMGKEIRVDLCIRHLSRERAEARSLRSL